MAESLSSIFSAVIVIVCLNLPGATARHINITFFDNCPDTNAPVSVRDIKYHFSDEDGLCDRVHATVDIATIDTEPYLLNMTLYRCADVNLVEPCLSDPMSFTELLDCDRLWNDENGPWSMIAYSMDGGVCGDATGVFSMTFARLKVEHLMAYLDIHDDTYNFFKMKLDFQSTLTSETRACSEWDFALIAV